MLLKQIKGPQDLKQLKQEELQQVVEEARAALLQKNQPIWWT